jgi:hypothetical protein
MGKSRKSSGKVTLVLIGLSALAGCGGDDTRRDVYKTREDCLADWANKPEDCKPATDPRHAASGFWYGPSYLYRSSGSGSSWTGGSATGRSLGSTSSSGATRGGFGATGRSSSGGG